MDRKVLIRSFFAAAVAAAFIFSGAAASAAGKTEEAELENILCVRAASEGKTSETAITPELISELIECGKDRIFEKFAGRYEKQDSFFFDCIVVSDAGLIFYFDNESKKPDWLKCDARASFNGARAGMDFGEIMKKLGRVPVVETAHYRGFEILYKFDDFYLRFSSFKPDGGESEVTIFSSRKIGHHLKNRTALTDDKPPKFKREKVPPVKDEADRDPELARAVSELKRAVKEKNYEVLLSYVDDGIGYSFGEEGKKPGFTAYWKLDKNPGKSRIWRELDQVFKLGGGKYSDEGEHGASYTTPYTFNSYIPLDEFTYQLITGSDVNVRRQPGLGSHVIEKLSYEAVYTQFAFNQEFTEDMSFDEISNERPLWRKVATASGKVGYVHGEYVRSRVDYRLAMSRKKGGWKVTCFVAGD